MEFVCPHCKQPVVRIKKSGFLYACLPCRYSYKQSGAKLLERKI